MEGKNMTGIEEMVALLASAIQDFKRSAERKPISDWGAGALATMERWHDVAVKFADMERKEKCRD